MTRKYILTGAPGSGKSSILLDLESRGEHIIREAAEDVIKLYQARGIEKPWEMPNFQKRITDLQIQRESRIPNDIRRVFIDRGIPDGLAYTRKESDIYKEIMKNIRPYEGVFLINMIGNPEKTKVRIEDYEEALEIERKINEVYLFLGYEIPKIPADSIEERTNIILDIIDEGMKLR